MATTKLVFDRAAVVSNIEKWTHYSAEAIFDTVPGKVPEGPILVCGLSSYPTNIKYKEITWAEFFLYVHKTGSPYRLYPRGLAAPFNENTVTFNDITLSVGYLCAMQYFPPDGFSSRFIDSWVDLSEVVQNGFALQPTYGTGYQWQIETPKGTNKPYIELTYGTDDVGLNVAHTYPVGQATISKSIDTTFTWDAVPTTDATLEPVEAVSAVLRWRRSGDSSYTTVACGSPTQCTIPANTFAEGTIQWQVVVTSNSGIVTTSNWTTTEVKEPISTAVASYPINTVLDGSAEQTFLWEHIISNGTAQRAFDLQTSPNGSTWSTIRHSETDQTSATFAPGTFEAGDLWWRARTYNLAGTAGAWSAAVHCIVIAAPEAPSITADDTSPRFVLRWQQSGQQAYELMVDGTVIAKTFSAESIYRHTGYLEPGTHTVRVRIQNKYQLWSGWGTASLQIENVEGAAIQLSASGNNEVGLSWSTSGNYAGYIVYRNGVKIAETAETAYVDHFAVGEAVYQVRGVYADSGNYTLSNVAAVTVSPETLLIACVSDPVWIKLPLSTSSLRSAGLSASQSVTYTHYIGSGLPGVEIGEAVSKSYDLDCAFKVTDLGRIRQFESLLGKVVCIKTPSQRRIVGVLSQMTARENRFYVTYSVPVTEVRWEEMEV